MTSRENAVQRAQNTLSGLAQRDLRDLWPKLSTLNPQELVEVLTLILPPLLDQYGSAAAALAADFYEEARVAAGYSSSFTPVLDEGPSVERVGILARWAVGPLFSDTPNTALALSLMLGAVDRQVLNQGRQTIEKSAAADPEKPTYARHASANACAFCAMLASRGPVYKSEESAGSVTGQGKALSTNVGRTSGRQAGGIKSRGIRSLGSKYHDHCHCVAVPVWPSQDYEPPPYVKRWDDAYIDASRKGRDTNGILATMRQSLGVG